MIRAPLPALSLATIAALCSCSDPDHGPVDGQRAFAHTDRIVGMSPRPPGSEGIRKVADYIEQQIRESTGLELQRHTFEKPDLADGVEYQNLWVEIPGRLRAAGEVRPPVLALAAHYDSKITHPGEQDFEFLGALDAAASCGVLLELADHIAKEQPVGPDVWIVFFDGEESIDWIWNDERALIGSRQFVADMSADEERFPNGLSARMKVLVLLDLLGGHDMKIDRDTASHAGLLQIFAKTATEMGRESILSDFESPMTDDHLPFKNRSVRVIDLIDFAMRDPESDLRDRYPEIAAQYAAWWHTPNDDMSQVSAESLELVGDLVWNALPKIDVEFYDAEPAGSAK